MDIKPARVLPPLSDAEFEMLKQSIQEFGVQVAIWVTAEGIIIDGHERWRAARELGIREVPKTVVGNLSESERRETAIRLNLLRRHLTSAQKRELISAQLKDNPVRSNRALAALVGVDDKTVGDCRKQLETTAEIPHLDKLVGLDGKTYRKPVVSVETSAQAKEAGRLLGELGEEAPAGSSSLRKLRTQLSEKQRNEYAARPITKLPSNITIDHADFRGWCKPLPDSVDLIVTDPPWGKDFLYLRKPFADFAARVLKPGGLIVCYVGNIYLADWLETLNTHSGLQFVWPIACVNDSGGTVMSHMKANRIHNGWRPVMLFSKGKTQLPHLIEDVIRTEIREKDLNKWQQPLSESRYFVSKLCIRGGVVCDPFVGSGTVSTAVAIEGGGRTFVGCDIDARSVRIARRRVEQEVKDDADSCCGPDSIAN